MLKVDILQMQKVQGHLEDCLTRFKSIISDTQEIEGKLGDVTNLPQLKRQIEEIVENEEQDSRQLERMIQSLETAMSIYVTQEEIILNYAEEIQSINKTQNVITQEIPSWISTMLG